MGMDEVATGSRPPSREKTPGEPWKAEMTTDRIAPHHQQKLSSSYCTVFTPSSRGVLVRLMILIFPRSEPLRGMECNASLRGCSLKRTLGKCSFLVDYFDYWFSVNQSSCTTWFLGAELSTYAFQYSVRRNYQSSGTTWFLGAGLSTHFIISYEKNARNNFALCSPLW